jgi:hypothetical protein
MATIDRSDAVTDRARFCPECGHPSDGANFCPGCGHNMGFAADRTLADPSVQAPSGGEKPRGRGVLIVVGATLGVVAVAVAAIVLLSGGSRSKTTSSNASASYTNELAKVLTPVVGANRALSGSLTSLDGSKHSVRSAKTDASQALAALVAARGGVAVLSAPSAQAQLAGEVQQALTADNGYLQAVSSALAAPTGPSAGQLQTLATGAQSALNPLVAVVSEAGNSVSGTDNLISWIQGATNHAQAHQQAGPSTGQSSAGGQSSSTTPAPASGSSSPAPAPSTPASTDCGGGLFAGPATSCPFAMNVQTAWQNTPGESNTVTAYSPVTGQSYTESCGPSGTGIMCTGVGANNSIWWN